MATTPAQARWRSRNRYGKKQLNVMARVETHSALEGIAQDLGLRGKAEAVAFCCFVVRWMMQQRTHNGNVDGLLATLAQVYAEEREIHAP